MEVNGLPIVKLGEILPASYKNGVYKDSDSYGSGTPILRITDFDNDGNLVNGRLRRLKLSPKEIKSYQLLQGDIVVNRVNSLTHLGKSIFWKGEHEKEVVYESNMMRIEPNPAVILPKFLIRVLQSHNARSHFRKVAKRAVAQCSISQQDVKSLKFPLPPLPEQKKIAQILSTWDQAITATERLLENSQQRKKGLMQQLLTGKKRLPGFEGEWHQYALTDVAKVIVSPVDKKSHPEEKPVQLCNYTDVYYNTRITKDMPFMEATAKDSEIEKYTLQAGDVVITKDSETPGDIAVPALVAEDLGGVICGYHLAILRARPSKLNGAFLNCLLSMPRTRYYFFSLATGATRFGLSVGAIHNAEVTLPPVPEQEAIANILTTCDDELEIISERLDRLKQEKKALMQQLLTGKRRVKVEADAA